MYQSLAQSYRSRHRIGFRSILLLVTAVTMLAIAANLSRQFPASAWLDLFGASHYDVWAAILYYAALPRLAVSLLAGASLGLAGAITQIVLRNPLAEPTTLGVSAGAALALTVATLWAPGLLAFGRDTVAIAGSTAAALVVFGLAWKRNISPIDLILGGLVVTLYCGALASVLALFHRDSLQGLFLWEAGSLVQNDWATAGYLLPRFIAALLIVGVLHRSLGVMSLDDGQARSLGLPLGAVRLLALGTVVVLSALIVSTVGVIGFVGLAAPALATLAGARTLYQRLSGGPVIGALLLCATDQCLQLLSRHLIEIPAGSATAVLGAPLMLWLMPRLGPSTPHSHTNPVPRRVQFEWRRIAVVSAVLVALIWPVLAFGQGATGWHFARWYELQSLISWRWPRTLAAAVAGAMLGAGGALLQRLTGNRMASPEVLGISSGASIGVIVSLFALATPDKATQICAAVLGGSATLAGILVMGRSLALSPQRVLLAGVAMGTIFTGLISFLMTLGDPRLQVLQAWMAGSTSHVTPYDAIFACVIALPAIAIAPLTNRWLTILPLGASSASAVGINVALARSLLLALVAILTAIPTLLIGPLSFIGLMAPHIVGMAGARRPMPQCLGAAVMGALIMVIADWLGRNLLFPYQIPAGLFATFIGCPYFLWLMRRGAA